MVAMLAPGTYPMEGVSGQYADPEAVVLPVPVLLPVPVRPAMPVELAVLLELEVVPLELELNPVGQYDDAFEGTENE